MILFENVVQVLYRSVSTAVAQRPFFFTIRDRRAVNRCQVGVDHSRLRMGSIAERLAKQPLGSIGVTQCRQQKIDGCVPQKLEPEPFGRPCNIVTSAPAYPTPALEYC